MLVPLIANEQRPGLECLSPKLNRGGVVPVPSPVIRTASMVTVAVSPTSVQLVSTPTPLALTLRTSNPASVAPGFIEMNVDAPTAPEGSMT
jgi:hypothetical protein